MISPSSSIINSNEASTVSFWLRFDKQCLLLRTISTSELENSRSLIKFISLLIRSVGYKLTKRINISFSINQSRVERIQSLVKLEYKPKYFSFTESLFN